MVAGNFKKLAVSTTGLSSLVTITADAVVLEKTDFSPLIARSVNLSIDMTASGVNGLDTGAVAASTWYYGWIISDGVNVRGLASLSSTAPTMPTGYTYKSRVTSFRTDGTANKYPLSYKQFGRRAQYVVAAGSNLTALPIMTSGTAGTSSVFVAVPTGNFVPPTASEIGVVLGGTYAGNNAACAPNLTYTFSAGGNSAPLVNSQSGATTTLVSSTFMILESTNVYWYASGTSTLNCNGWVDNI